jgi:cation diffusion facilitator family transporter
VRLRRAASYASVAAAVVLIIAKLGAWLATGSVSLLTSVIDSVVDVGASLVTLVGVRYAERPADLDHRFGHGKAEALAAFVQAVFLAGAGVALVFQAIERLTDPKALQRVDLGLGVIGLSLVMTCALVTLQTVVIRRTGSTAIAADRTHYIADIVLNITVLAALGLSRLTGSPYFDPLFALVIGCYMAYGGQKIAARAMPMLLDRELPDADRRRIEALVAARVRITGMHDLRTRNAGDRVFVEFHVEVDGDLTVEQGHEIVDEVETAVCALFPGEAEVIVHMEPAGIIDERLDNRIRATTG